MFLHTALMNHQVQPERNLYFAGVWRVAISLLSSTLPFQFPPVKLYSAKIPNTIEPVFEV